MISSKVNTIIVDKLKSKGAKRISLFGSYSRGDQRVDSDIDILVEFEKGSCNSLMDVVGVEQELENSLKKDVDLVTLGSVSPHILPFIKKEEIVIYEK